MYNEDDKRGAAQGRSQDFTKGESQCVTPRVLTTLSCREYLDTEETSTK